MSTLYYSSVTSVIVQVADSVTESSSGNLSWGPPQTSGTGPLPAGWWQTDFTQTTLCPRPCSPLLSTPLLTTLGSPLLPGSSVSSRLSFCTPTVFSIEVTGCLCWVSLISLSFNKVSCCKTVTFLPFDPWLEQLLLAVIYQDLKNPYSLDLNAASNVFKCTKQHIKK